MSEITNYEGLIGMSVMTILTLSASVAAGVLYLNNRDKRTAGFKKVPSQVIQGEYTSAYTEFYESKEDIPLENEDSP